MPLGQKRFLLLAVNWKKLLLIWSVTSSICHDQTSSVSLIILSICSSWRSLIFLPLATVCVCWKSVPQHNIPRMKAFSLTSCLLGESPVAFSRLFLCSLHSNWQRFSNYCVLSLVNGEPKLFLPLAPSQELACAIFNLPRTKAFHLACC